MNIKKPIARLNPKEMTLGIEPKKKTVKKKHVSKSLKSCTVVFAKNLKKEAIFQMKYAEGCYVLKFKDGSEWFFMRSDFTTVLPKKRNGKTNR